MKNAFFPGILILVTLLSCSKDDSTPPPGSATLYMSLTAGSTRNYEYINNNPPSAPSLYTLTSTTRDTTVNSRSYHVFTNSNGPSEYYNNTGNDYYTFQNLPEALGGSSEENLYLKDNVAVNSTWNQTFDITISGIPLTVTIINKIIEKGVAKSVNSINYNDVIHVKTDVSASSVFGPVTGLTSDIHSYYAPKVGLIQNTTVIDLDFMGFISNTNTQTNLKSSTIL